MAAAGTEHKLLAQDCGDLDPEEAVSPSAAPPQSRTRGRSVAAVAAALLLGVAGALVVATRTTGGAAGASAGVVGLASTHAEAEEKESAREPEKGEEEEEESEPEAAECSMALEGSACYEKVVWAMTDGIDKHSEWYPGLTKKSLYQDFQKHLSSDKKNKCPKPCEQKAGCQTAKPGSECWDNVQWSMTKGIEDHPKWYPGLTEESPMEAFQNHLHSVNSTACPKPACNPQPFKRVSLFCWMVVRSQGYELGLVKAQLDKKAGTFACDDYALVSDKDLGIDGVKTLRISTTMASGYTGDGTSPNAPIFVEAWDKIREDGRYAAYDWIVKCDPDTVLIPDRLKMKLVPTNQPSNPYPPPFKAAPGAGMWVTNCDKMAGWGAGWGSGWPMMYGAVEIISREAIDNYFANEEMCKNSFPWQGMGEDAFMGVCLRKLKTGELFMKQGDGACAGGVCTDKNLQAFHPRKDITSWMQCWGEATR